MAAAVAPIEHPTDDASWAEPKHYRTSSFDRDAHGERQVEPAIHCSSEILLSMPPSRLSTSATSSAAFYASISDVPAVTSAW
jgi:hypothetical protein